MNKILYHVKLVCKTLLYYRKTSKIKKEENLWLFGAWKGTTYNDNSKYLFEYVCKNCPQIHAVWLTKNTSVYEHVSSLGYPVVLYPSNEAESIIERAKYLFQTEGYKDTGEMPVGGATVIQLWHGSPSKAMNWFKKINGIKKRIVDLENGDKRNFYWVSQSPYYSKFYHEYYDIPMNHFINTGSPRCDAINNTTSAMLERIKRDGNYNQIIFYLPTHRNWGTDYDNQFVLQGLDIVEKALKGTNICFLYKPHPNEVELFRSNKEYKNVVILEGKEQDQQDLYQYLFACDALVSDYSSVIYDYLICNKPIVLFTYDFERYQSTDGGVPIDYINKPVGPRVETWQDMINSVRELLIKDSWKEKRECVQSYFNGYHSGQNSARLVEFLLNNRIPE